MLLLPLQELAEDAPQRPDVHRPGVFPVAHDHLRRAVARRRDDGREHIAPREGSERRLRVALAVEILRRGEGRERRLVRSRAKTPEGPSVSFSASRLSRGVEREIRLPVVVHGDVVRVSRRVACFHRPSFPVSIPEKSPVTTRSRLFSAAREAKVANLHHAPADARLTAQRVRALYVPVPDAGVVEVQDRARQLPHQRAHLARGHLAAHLVQVAALGDLERHVQVDGERHEREGGGVHDSGAAGGGGEEDVEDLDDVRVVQAVQDHHLAQDALRRVHRGERVRHALERDEPRGPRVEGFDHRPEAAATQHRDQPVVLADAPRLDLAALRVLDVPYPGLVPRAHAGVRPGGSHGFTGQA